VLARLDLPVEVVLPRHALAVVERAGGGLRYPLGLPALCGVVEVHLGVVRVVGGADPARVEVGHDGTGGVGDAARGRTGDGQAAPQQVAVRVVRPVHVLAFGAVPAVEGQVGTDHPVVRVVGVCGDIV